MNKTVLMLFLVSLVFGVIGFCLKIFAHPAAGIILMISVFLQMFSLFLLTIKLLLWK